MYTNGLVQKSSVKNICCEQRWTSVGGFSVLLLRVGFSCKLSAGLLWDMGIWKLRHGDGVFLLGREKMINLSNMGKYRTITKSSIANTTVETY